ncbi:hypothetical protein BGX21_005003, partial [Mortierella sp. AD011]
NEEHSDGEDSNQNSEEVGHVGDHGSLKEVASSMEDAKKTTSKSKRAKPFTASGRRSFGERYENLSAKWKLQSGTIVEDVIFKSGKDTCKSLCFMIDVNDPNTASLFSKVDWEEITADLPSQATYSEEVFDYLDRFSEVNTIGDLERVLSDRPTDPDSRIVLDLFKITDPSPFSVINALGEMWWLQNAWGATRKLTLGVPHAFILPGEKASIDSTERINENLASTDVKRVGAKEDLIWRTLMAPECDWGVAEAATEWDPMSLKYCYESTHKLPRVLHDILVGRTTEVGSVDALRSEYVSGLIFG